jgi:hypothetical protein
MVKLVTKMGKKSYFFLALAGERERESIARVKIRSSDELGKCGPCPTKEALEE